MGNEIVPEHDRRRKEKGLITHIVETFNGKQGRKVAFGIWLFWVTNGLLVKGFVSNQQWFYCMIISALLIGFGTVVDSIVSKMGDAVVAVFAERVEKFKTVISKTTEVTSSVATNTPQS